MADPLALLLALADAAESGDPIPDNVALWLRRGIEAHLDGEALESALRLRGCRYRWLLHRRDSHLRCAWDLLDGSPWRRSIALAAAIRRFERSRKRDRDPAKLHGIERELAEVYRLGVTIPTSARQLHNIVKSDGRSNFVEGAIG